MSFPATPFDLESASGYGFEIYEPVLNKFLQTAEQSKLNLSILVSGDARARYLSLSPRAQESLVQRLKYTNEILENSVRVLGTHPGHFFLRATLKKFGWRISPEVFEMIAETDCVEFYGTDLMLKMFNMRFMQLCSYSLEETLTHEFFDLFERDSAITQKIIENFKLICEGKIEIATDLGPDHLVTEKSSLRKKRFWFHSKALAPVYGPDRSIIGGVYISSAYELPDFDN